MNSAGIVKFVLSILLVAGLCWLGWYVFPFYLVWTSGAITALISVMFALAGFAVLSLVWLV
jgi:hypothetical protein